MSERSIYRDLRELEDAGIRIEFDRERESYRVAADVFLPPVHLTIDEALALTVLCEQIAEPEGIPYTKPAWRALGKVQARLPPAVRGKVDRLAKRTVVQTAAAMPADGFVSVYDAVQESIATGRAISCRYESRNPQTSSDEFVFEPYALFFAVRAWYTVGFHRGRDEIRTLELSRFLQADPCDHEYEIPPDFSLDGHLGNAWRMIRGEEDHNVELRFDAEFAKTVTDTLWHQTQETEFHDDGSATFRCTVSGLDEIVWWVLSMGPHCTVVKPTQLRERVAAAATQTARLYAAEP